MSNLRFVTNLLLNAQSSIKESKIAFEKFSHRKLLKGAQWWHYIYKYNSDIMKTSWMGTSHWGLYRYELDQLSIFILMGLLISRIAKYREIPLKKRSYRPYYIKKCTIWFRLHVGGMMAIYFLRKRLALRLMGNITGPYSINISFKIWMKWIRTRCGCNKMALRPIRRTKLSTYCKQYLVISWF